MLVNELELQHRDADDPYWVLYETKMRSFLAESRSISIDSGSEAVLIRQTRGGGTLEGCARHAGFVLGFEYCRRLLVGAPGRAR